MKTPLSIFAAMAALLAFALADDASMAKLYLGKLEQDVAVAKEKTDAPYAWQQCEMTLQGLEESVAKLPASDRAPYQAKIAQYKPLIVAGAARNRAGMIVRRIRSHLENAQADIAAGNNKLANLQAAYFDKLDEYFAEPDLKALPAEELKKLKAEYAEIKKGAK